MCNVFWCTLHTGNWQWCSGFCSRCSSECPMTTQSPTIATSNCSTNNLKKASPTTSTESPHTTTKASPSFSKNSSTLTSSYQILVTAYTCKQFTIVFCILVISVD